MVAKKVRLVPKKAAKTVVKAKVKDTPIEDTKPKEFAHPKIKKTGYYDGLPDDFYHGDCCDSPSLSSSGARQIIEECPKAYWHGSPLNPNRARKENKNFDMGHALHLIFLEPDRFKDQVVEIEFDGYRTNESKLQKQLAYNDGKIPLLTEDLKKVWRMREALYQHPVAKRAFSKGVAERSYFWKDKETGVWLKARPDWKMPTLVVDYKTSASVNPREFKSSVFNWGYYIQQPWYLEGIRQVEGEDIDEWYFVAQEKEEPFLVSVFEVDPAAIAWGEKLMRAGIRKYAECLNKNKWPEYRDPKRPDQDGVISIDIPQWAHFQLAERQESGEFGEES